MLLSQLRRPFVGVQRRIDDHALLALGRDESDGIGSYWRQFLKFDNHDGYTMLRHRAGSTPKTVQLHARARVLRQSENVIKRLKTAFKIGIVHASS